MGGRWRILADTVGRYGLDTHVVADDQQDIRGGIGCTNETQGDCKAGNPPGPIM